MDNIKTSNLLVIDGGEVKSGDGGMVEGWAIVFGSEEEPDSSVKRDFFTEDSFVRGKNSFEIPLYYEHGLGLYDDEIGEAVITKEEKGWKAVAQINTASELGAKVYEAVKAEPHGFSTGALTHLVKRESRPNDTNFLKRWVAGELSLTKRPAERKAVVESVKSVNGELVHETAWTEKEAPLAVSIFDADGELLWSSEDEILKVESVWKDAKSIEFKGVSGSARYDLWHYDEDGDKSYEVTMYEHGTAEEWISKMRKMLDAMSEATRKSLEPTEEDFEARVKKIIAAEMGEKAEVTSDEEVNKLKAQLDDVNKELAEKTSELSTREEALTIANEKIAQLEILAGATETITKYKGK